MEEDTEDQGKYKNQEELATVKMVAMMAAEVMEAADKEKEVCEVLVEKGEDTNQVKRVNGRKDAAMDGRLHLAR